MTTPALEPCIYCRVLSAPSREHVLQKSLGGDLTTITTGTQKPTVCQKCNTAFSTIDQALAERSIVALARVAHTDARKSPARLGGEHFHYDENHEIWTEVHLINGVRPHVPPQLHLKGGQLAYFGSAHDEKDEFVKLLSARHRSGALAGTHVKIGPSDRATTPRLVMHRSNDYFVRAGDPTAAEAFLSLLVAKWPELEPKLAGAAGPVETTPEPTIDIRMSVRLDDNYRAIAKMAFNFLAIRKGGPFVLRSEFDSIRDYIRGLNIEHPSQLAPGQIAVDTRFVEQGSTESQPIVPTTSHAIGLFYDAPRLFGLVTLYGSFSFIVRLAEFQMDDQLEEFHEFSIDGTWNKPLDPKEMEHRIKARERS